MNTIHYHLFLQTYTEIHDFHVIRLMNVMGNASKDAARNSEGKLKR